jgi:plastocyanin
MVSSPSRRRVSLLLIVGATVAFAGISLSSRAEDRGPKVHKQVIVPGEDRFTPFALTIRAGDFVQWVNMDTDNHTVVSNDFFNTAGNNGTNFLLLGTDANGGKPGTLVLHFSHPGTFVYYCRFHAHLDDDHQPAAPGPDGGIQDPNGNFGTPMNGIITVLPGDQGRD